MVRHKLGKPEHPWRNRLHEIIFEADTPAGKAFDVALICAILLSIVVIMLESVTQYRERYGPALHVIEWGFTILFSIEYLLRLLAVGRPWRYALSFFGIVDLLAVLPSYLSLFIAGSQSLMVIRSLRLLRIFRVFKLGRYLTEANVLLTAIRTSGPKVIVFLGTLLNLVVIMCALMYLIEGEENGFTSIPRSMYWAIVTMTTVGYGDISPQTVPGQVLASILMIMGYSIIAVPTGIVSVELAKTTLRVNTHACKECGAEGHDMDAKFCMSCGTEL